MSPRVHAILRSWPIAGLLTVELVAGIEPSDGVAAQDEAAAFDEPKAAAEPPQKLESEHLSNLIRVHERVLSGGLPEDDAAFKELRDRGVRTVISVDGMTPDVDTARKYGLRYVHLPHGYDGIPHERALELAKAVRDLEGPVYIHCHHGKHRSPAAAAVACETAGLISLGTGTETLKLAGTNPGYRGLFQAVEKAKAAGGETLDAVETSFPERTAIPPTAEAMVHLSHTYEHVGQIAEAKWTTPADHPDLDPAHEALLLQEHFTELLRTEDTASRPAAYADILRRSEASANALHALLAESKATKTEVDLTRLNELNASIASDCKSCHKQFRDVPIAE